MTFRPIHAAAIFCLFGSAVTAPAADLMPDLIQAEAPVADGWYLDHGTIPGRTLLRLPTVTPNIGQGAMELRGGALGPHGQEVFQRIYDDQGGSRDVLAGVFVHHAEHDHIHFEGFSQFHLRAVAADGGAGAIVRSGDKISFCLLDSEEWDLALPGAPAESQYVTCTSERQGISVGWADVYEAELPDQWIDVTGIADGDYWLEIVADPDDLLRELDEGNNVAQVRIQLSNPFTSVRGRVWDDADADGDRDSGEAVVAGRTVWLDLDGDGVQDAGEPTGTTGGDGRYRVGSVPAGAFDVCLQPRHDWRPTVPAGGAQAIDSDGIAGIAGVDFGVVRLNSVRGSVFLDLTGDGARSWWEPGLPGQRVFLDEDGDAVLDLPRAIQRTRSPGTPIEDLTTINSSITVGGPAAAVAEVEVTLAIAHSYMGDLAIALVSPGGVRVPLALYAGVDGEGYDDTRFADGADAELAASHPPYHGVFRPARPLAALAGEPVTGAWTLEVSDDAEEDQGVLTSWSLRIVTRGEAAGTTNWRGAFDLDAIRDGSYRLRLLDGLPLEVTRPAAGSYPLHLERGETATRDFGLGLPWLPVGRG